MNKITERLLKAVSDWMGVPQNAAYNIREDGQCAGRQSTKNIQITSKTDKPALISISSPKPRARPCISLPA